MTHDKQSVVRELLLSFFTFAELFHHGRQWCGCVSQKNILQNRKNGILCAAQRRARNGGTFTLRTAQRSARNAKIRRSTRARLRRAGMAKPRGKAKARTLPNNCNKRRNALCLPRCRMHAADAPARALQRLTFRLPPGAAADGAVLSSIVAS